MTKRIRQIKKQNENKILYDMVHAEGKNEHNKTKMFVQDIININNLKKQGVINEH